MKLTFSERRELENDEKELGLEEEKIMMNKSLNWVEDEVTNDETQLTNSSPAICAENATKSQFESKSKDF